MLYLKAPIVLVPIIEIISINEEGKTEIRVHAKCEKFNCWFNKRELWFVPLRAEIHMWELSAESISVPSFLSNIVIKIDVMTWFVFETEFFQCRCLLSLLSTSLVNTTDTFSAVSSFIGCYKMKNLLSPGTVPSSPTAMKSDPFKVKIGNDSEEEQVSNCKEHPPPLFHSSVIPNGFAGTELHAFIIFCISLCFSRINLRNFPLIATWIYHCRHRDDEA